MVAPELNVGLSVLDHLGKNFNFFPIERNQRANSEESLSPVSEQSGMEQFPGPRRGHHFSFRLPAGRPHTVGPIATSTPFPTQVVHTVGPNYEHPRPGREDVAQNACQDTDLLAAAYTNSILKFGQVAVAKNITTLRLPVISAADKNIGQCKDLLQDMTRAALKTTFQNAGVRKILADPRMRIILCLFGSRADLKVIVCRYMSVEFFQVHPRVFSSSPSAIIPQTEPTHSAPHTHSCTTTHEYIVRKKIAYDKI